MEYYIELILKKQWIIGIILLLFISLIVFISSIIDKHFGGIYKFTIRTYLLYLPIGLFMALWYLITERNWLSKTNTYTFWFIVYSSLIALDTLSEKLLKKNESLRFFNSRIDRHCSKIESSRLVFLVIPIIIIPYTFVGFIKLLIKLLA